ncbi:hypothetical protein BJY04DRAFT_215151 [Aspergillus karnatakaensis]|uniref:uncharacterized protein n=1 Tax=Aspergillus karnatakaensis TaxID=1810916 RepID=UPI003CCD67B3
MKVSQTSGAIVALCMNMAMAQITIPLPPLPSISIPIPSSVTIPTVLPTCLPEIPTTLPTFPTAMVAQTGIPNNNQMQEFERSHPRQITPLDT